MSKADTRDGRSSLTKVQSVDQRMRLECGVGFRQLRTCRRNVRGSYVPDQQATSARLFDHLVGAQEEGFRD